jgi:hypothetical protein
MAIPPTTTVKLMLRPTGGRLLQTPPTPSMPPSDLLADGIGFSQLLAFFVVCKYSTISSTFSDPIRIS